MPNYLPGYIQLNIRRLLGESRDKAGLICVPCLIVRFRGHHHLGTASEAQADPPPCSPTLPHLHLHPSPSIYPTPLSVESTVSQGGGKKVVWEKRVESRFHTLNLVWKHINNRSKSQRKGWHNCKIETSDNISYFPFIPLFAQVKIQLQAVQVIHYRFFSIYAICY